MNKKNFSMLLIAGHGQGDSGAVGNGHRECDMTRDLVSRIRDNAVQRGIAVDVYDMNKNAVKQIKAGNMPPFAGHTYCFEVHFNSSGNQMARGSMFYIHKDEAGWSVEQKILDRLYALGSRKAWDGIVKSNRQWPEGLLVQNRCKEQGVSHGLLETCFISNAEDCNWYFANKDAIAAAIVDGIVDGFGLEKGEQESTFKPYMVKVTDSALNIRKGPGTNKDIVGSITDNGSYTIVEEADGPGSKKWGRLLSGAGWIALDSDLVQR